jgi:hypothetical protein
MSARLHDLIIALSSTILVAALLSSVWRQTVVPKAMSAANAVGLFAMTINLATMRYWYSASTELCDATAWAFLYAVATTAAPNQWRRRVLLPTATVAAAAAIVAIAFALGLERQLTTNFHDLIASATIIALLAASLPGVYRRTMFPLATGALITTTITMLSVNFATMHYWDAMFTEFGSLACWAFLLWIAIAARRSSADGAGREPRLEAPVTAAPGTPQGGLTRPRGTATQRPHSTSAALPRWQSSREGARRKQPAAPIARHHGACK